MCECHAFHKSTTAVAHCLGLQLLFDIISHKLIQTVSTSTMLTYRVTNGLAISIYLIYHIAIGRSYVFLMIFT